MTELPLGWLEAPLSEIIQPRGEKVQPSALPNKPFIGMDHVEAHTTKILGSVPASTMKSAAARFYEGDVLYGRLRPYLNKVARPRFDGLASAEFIVFPSTPLVDSAWLQLRLNAIDFVSFASHLNEGDRPRVDFDQIGVFGIRVPPLNEQRRIVEKIETLFADLDTGVESLTRARARLALYRQSILKAAFEGRLTADWRAEHSAEWPVEHLGDHLSFVTSGSRGWARYYADSGDIFVRAQNLKHDRLDLEDIAYVTLPKGKTEGIRTRILEGDVLVTITGANVTKTAPVLSDLGTAYVSQHVALCRPKDTLDTKYLHWFLVAEAAGRKQLTDAAYGAGKPGLNLQNIKDVVIPVPGPVAVWCRTFDSIMCSKGDEL